MSKKKSKQVYADKSKQLQSTALTLRIEENIFESLNNCLKVMKDKKKYSKKEFEYMALNIRTQSINFKAQVKDMKKQGYKDIVTITDIKLKDYISKLSKKDISYISPFLKYIYCVVKDEKSGKIIPFDIDESDDEDDAWKGNMEYTVGNLMGETHVLNELIEDVEKNPKKYEKKYEKMLSSGSKIKKDQYFGQPHKPTADQYETFFARKAQSKRSDEDDQKDAVVSKELKPKKNKKLPKRKSQYDDDDDDDIGGVTVAMEIEAFGEEDKDAFTKKYFSKWIKRVAKGGKGVSVWRYSGKEKYDEAHLYINFDNDDTDNTQILVHLDKEKNKELFKIKFRLKQLQRIEQGLNDTFFTMSHIGTRKQCLSFEYKRTKDNKNRYFGLRSRVEDQKCLLYYVATSSKIKKKPKAPKFNN